MRKLLELIAVLALLNVWGSLALADDPALSAQPDVRPGAEGSTAGGSASASGGDAGPAAFSFSRGELSRSGGHLGIAGLPSTATAPASLVLFGAVLALAGLVLLRQSHRKN